MKWYWWAIALGLLTAGALGFKTDADCLGMTSPSDEAICWHEVAVSYASFPGNRGAAIQACNEVMNSGASTAEAQANMCYADVAEHLIRLSPQDTTAISVCDNIQESPASRILKGGEVSKEACKEKVRQLAKRADYRCALLPVFVLFIMWTIYSRQADS